MQNFRSCKTFEQITSAERPLIPLGARGKIRGTDYEVIGFERRTIEVDGIRYHWNEYVLFNPYKGFRYLTEYNGHWNDVAICKEQPTVDPRLSSHCTKQIIPAKYTSISKPRKPLPILFSASSPWEVRVGERAASQTTSIHRECCPARRCLKKGPNHRRRVFMAKMYGALSDCRASRHQRRRRLENEPSPFSANITAVWLAFCCVYHRLLAMMTVDRCVRELRFSRDLPTSIAYHGLVSRLLLPIHSNWREGTSNVEVATSASVTNDWIYLNYALINQDSGEAWDFGREVSFYSGYDSDGSVGRKPEIPWWCQRCCRDGIT